MVSVKVIAWAANLSNLAIILLFEIYYFVIYEKPIPFDICRFIFLFSVVTFVTSINMGERVERSIDSGGVSSDGPIVVDIESAGELGHTLSYRSVSARPGTEDEVLRKVLSALNEDKRNTDEEVKEDKVIFKTLQRFWGDAALAQTDNAQAGGEYQQMYEDVTNLTSMRVDEAQERICRKYKRLMQLEKNNWALQVAIDMAKEQAAVPKNRTSEERLAALTKVKKQLEANDADHTWKYGQLKAL